MRSAAAGWALLALIGLVLAAGAAYAAGRLADQPIGLASEPLSAGEDLAPPATPRATPTPWPTRTPRPGRTPTPAPTAPPAVTPVPTVNDDRSGGDDDASGGDDDAPGGDDSSGRGRGRGRGRGGEDDD